MQAETQIKYISLQIPATLYQKLEDNKRYFDWTNGIVEIIKQKLLFLQKNEGNKSIPKRIPEIETERTKVKVNITIPEIIFDQLKRYEKDLAWKEEILYYLQEKEKSIEKLKTQRHGLDRPQDIEIPKIQNKNASNSPVNTFLTEFIKTGSEITGIPAITRQINNSTIDHERTRVLQDLPEQHLSIWEINEMKGFFRRHNFYVTKFPTTPAKEYPIACEIIYCYFKYIGGMKNDVLIAKTYQRELERRTTAQTYELLMKVANENLEKIFQSEVIKYLFTLPQEKRIDVEIFDSKTMEQIADFKEEAWTIKELYPFMDNKKYVVHVYDVQILNNVFIILSENDGFFKVKDLPLYKEFENGYIKTIDLIGNKEISAIKLLKLIRGIYGERPLENYLKEKKPWISHDTNVAFLIFRIKFSKDLQFGGIIFTRSILEENPEIRGQNLDKIINNENVTNLKDYYKNKRIGSERDNEGDSEFKIILTLHNLLRVKKILLQNDFLSHKYSIFNYFRYIGNERNTNTINTSMTKGINVAIDLFTERNPCTACENTIEKFQLILNKRFNNVTFSTYSLFGNDDTFYDKYPQTEFIENKRTLKSKIEDIMMSDRPVQFYLFTKKLKDLE